MTAAIPPIPPIPPVSPVGATPDVATAAAPPAPPEPGLVDRFTALMQEIGHGPAGRVHAHGPSQLHQMISTQDEAAKATFEHIQAFSIGGMANSPLEAAAGIMRMQNEMAMLSFKLNVVNTLAQSGKSAVQTLMKNQ